MNSNHINPFLESSMHVLEQMCRIRPSLGSPSLKQISFEGPVWLKISIIGDMEGDILYHFPMEVALRLISDMMGGFTVTELDEIGQSAIAELGNMISGNASTILYSKGVTIDITPPTMIRPDTSNFAGKALSVPLRIDGLGEVGIYVNFKAKQAS